MQKVLIRFATVFFVVQLFLSGISVLSIFHSPARPISKITLSPNEMVMMKGETTMRCISRGQQPKCLVQNLVVYQNRLYAFGSISKFPLKRLFLADDLIIPLRKNHHYEGHSIQSADAAGWSLGTTCAGAWEKRPTVFFFRISGHSTYHLWQNNLGPLYATLHENFGLQENFADVLLDPSQLRVALVDRKPAEGPKAPSLLNTLLQTFTDAPLLNTSAMSVPKCFATAILGVSASHFEGRKLSTLLLRRLIPQLNISTALPLLPRVLYISRNHRRVVRGRKVSNEEELMEALNESVKSYFGAHARAERVFMESLPYREQLRLAASAQVVFAPHGGGVANCVWMPKGAVMVEFVAPIGRTLLRMYDDMCRRVGVRHLSFLAAPDPNDEAMDLKKNRRLFSNMWVPSSTLRIHAKQAFEVYRENYRKQMERH